MISKLIRDALKAQLSAAATGLNARLAALAPAYGQSPYVIDWTDTSTNFMFGEVNPDAIEESSVFTYPFCTIDTAGAQDMGLVYSATFSGRVPGIIDVHHSWPDASILSDFCSLMDLTEEAVIACVKDPSQQNWSTWGNLLLMKGGVSAQRSKLAFGGENWRRSLRVACIFELAV